MIILPVLPSFDTRPSKTFWSLHPCPVARSHSSAPGAPRGQHSLGNARKAGATVDRPMLRLLPGLAAAQRGGGPERLTRRPAEGAACRSANGPSPGTFPRRTRGPKTAKSAALQSRWGWPEAGSRLPMGLAPGQAAGAPRAAARPAQVGGLANEDSSPPRKGSGDHRCDCGLRPSGHAAELKEATRLACWAVVAGWGRLQPAEHGAVCCGARTHAKWPPIKLSPPP